MAAILCGIAALTSSASFAAAKQEFARPPYAGNYEPVGVDERGLWMQMDEDERRSRDFPTVVKDPALNAYLRAVLCKTVGFDRCEAARIYVVKDRTFNASMAPNGLMVVHLGLLARVHSEAELAAVLGHEFAHFELRHTLKRFRRWRTGSDITSWLGLAGAALNQSTAVVQGSVIESIFSYNREEETEADLLGAAYVGGSPYRLAAAGVWQRLLDEENATRAERGARKIKRYTPGPLDTHPTNLQRISYFTKLEAEAAGAGEDAMVDYRTATSPFLGELFDSMVKGNEFAAADFVIRARGDAMGWDGPLLTVRGELYRVRANPRDLVTARQFFEKATTYPDAPPESWRGLGLSALRLGEADVGRAALSEYLKRRPDARDAATIKLMLEN